MELPGAFDRLRDERVWVAWADEGGRKVPKSPHGGNAKSNDPSTWGTYAEAEAARAKNGYSGVGLMLTDGYTGIDLDGAVEDGKIADWAQEIVDEFGSYAEISPSGTGLHILGWSDMEQTGPIGRNNRGGVEVYNHGRYFTVTGDVVRDAPLVDVTPDLPAFIARHFSGESPERVVRRRIGNLARDQVKRQANRAMAENCVRDGVRYARVPRGSETCGFCVMLASRGYVYTTPEAAQHSHDGCDCKVMPGFDGAEVEGYDPDSMYDLYREARERAEHKTNGEISREIEKIVQERVGRERSDIPRSKTAGYALNPDHPKGRHKAEAFRSALGFTKDDAPEVELQIYEWMGRNDPKPKGSNEYGDLFKTDMEMTGRNGKTARVIVSWIVYKGDVKYHLTSLYIKKRKRGGGNDGEGT